MQRKIEIIGLCLGWFAVIAQFYLILENRKTNALETTIRFFSFFTILTNIWAASFLTVKVFGQKKKRFGPFPIKGSLTALTTFILIVGLVYQIVLRPLWEPTGLQWVVDELLHTVIPLFMLAYWFLYATTDDFNIRKTTIWLLYPIIYIILILIRGNFSKFYPYPFLNIPEIGMESVLINILSILVLAIFIMAFLVFIGKRYRSNIKPFYNEKM